MRGVRLLQVIGAGSMRVGKEKLLIGFTCLFLVVGGGIILRFLKVALTEEDMYFQRGGLDYYLFIGATFRNFPLPEIDGEPVYHAGMGDGPKVPSTGILFYSRARNEELRSQIDRYLTANGYTFNAEGSDSTSYQYEKVGRPLFFRVEEKGNGKCQVVAEELEPN
jgi:hypothetical protein